MLGIRFDLRVPDFSPATPAQQYAACLEMCSWADAVGLDVAVLSEHHGAPDGYLPAPIPLAAAILGRTQRIRVTIAAVLAPLNDPVRVAEQLAVVDLVAPGRLSVVAALGYRTAEFEMAGVEKARRGALLEEAIGVWRRAWTGEPFEVRGRVVRVTPRPATPGGPLVMIGGSTPAAARRAARLRCGFFPADDDPAIAEAYRDECARVGFGNGFCNLPSGPTFVHVAEDPDDVWAGMPDGRQVCCRLIYLGLVSPVVAALAEDARLGRLAALSGLSLVAEQDCLDGISVVIKQPGATSGLADLPWHQDCGLGGHPVLCPSVAVGIQLDAATAASGRLHFLAGSHRGSVHQVRLGDEQRLPTVAVDTEPGDVTVHYGHILHAAPEPTGRGPGRRALYVTFTRPETIDFIGRMRGYNDVLFQRDGVVHSVDELIG